MKNEIVLYKPDELSIQLEVLVENETVWLNRQQIATLFGRDVKTIGKHVNNVYSEGELERKSTVANFATVQNEGDRIVERMIDYYDLDVIISVGYRVKSKQGTQFRIWATKVLKDYLMKGYSINTRINRIEDRVDELNQKVQEIDLHINSKLLPTQGIFFDGQIFDAYQFVSDLIRSAEKSIILIDNYLDDSVLTILNKRNKGVKAQIYTEKIKEDFKLDLQKYNAQYENIDVIIFKKSHDRFLIIDEKIVYHLGASLKDLGKKWFAFSKMETPILELLEKI